VTTPNAIGILGTGSYLPDRVVGNDEIAARVPGAAADWIVRKTLILERRYAADDQAVSDLAIRAARAALDQAGLGVERIDYLILSTSTGDHPQPPTSCLVQNGLGAWNAACFDVNAVCAGFVYALASARALCALRPGAHALVVSAEIYSRFVDFDERTLSPLLGDGAGAAVVGPVDGLGILDLDLANRGDAADLIKVEVGGSRHPPTPESVALGGHFVRMQGRKVRDFVLDEVPPALAKLLARTGVAPGEVDHLVAHQPNGILLTELSERCELVNARTHLTIQRYGNMGSACLPVTLDDANRSGALKNGELVALSGFGGGMSLGHAVLRWTAAPL
jgi:3-oxoacyl-(acyl-carrier-protein) synthase III